MNTKQGRKESRIEGLKEALEPYAAEVNRLAAQGSVNDMAISKILMNVVVHHELKLNREEGYLWIYTQTDLRKHDLDRIFGKIMGPEAGIRVVS